MRYQNVCLESFAYTLPEETVSSAEIERRLATLYERLRLPEGRLELISGVAARRFWPPGTMPGQISVQTAEKAIQQSGIERRHFGALVHGSVCRDFLEPATACGVHHGLRLPDRCAVYDVSNACLGLLNGIVQVANMIELGQIAAGVVVGTESSRALVESTIEHLNADHSLSRRDIKTAFASLTIGSGSAAVALCNRQLSRRGNRLLGGVMLSASEHCELCQGGRLADGAADNGPLLMQTEADALMQAGLELARGAFADFLAEMNWTTADIDRTFCHQVGRTHQKLLLETLGLDPRVDFTTLEFLGNTGSAALPITAAIGIEHGQVRPGDRVALLGIGSGINVVMLGAEWGNRDVG
jgi:3-oxoacyl-[acyl-carrier-protein] synthase III